MPDPTRGYDWLSPCYRMIEWAIFGNRLDLARQALLDSLPTISGFEPPPHVLVLGDGNGRLLGRLMHHFPQARFVSVDQSQAMLRRQSAAIGDHADRVRLVHARIDRDFDWANDDLNLVHVDLVVAAFFLDCFREDDLKTLTGNLVSALRPNAHIYWVDFLEPSRPSMRTRLVRWWMLRFFRLATQHPNEGLIDIGRILNETGCPIELQWSDQEGFLHAAIHRVTHRHV